MIIYGVFEVPRYLIEAREVESIWTEQERANDRAMTRSIQVHGTVVVVSWQVNNPGSRRVLKAFVDGSPIAAAKSGIPRQ